MDRPREAVPLDLPLLSRARVSGIHAQLAVATAQNMGADMRRLGAACGLGDLGSNLPESISVANYTAFLDAAATQLDDPLFGLHVGQRARVTDAAGYGMVLCACRDFRLVVEQAIRFECLAHDLGRSQIIERDGVARYRWHSPWLHLPGGRHLVESQAAYIRTLANWLAGVALPVFNFSFSHAAPPGVALDEYERALCAPVRFGAEFSEGCFPAALLDAPVLNADTSLFPLLVQVAERRLVAHKREADEAPVVDMVRDCIRAQMTNGRANVADIAAATGMSARTLQRKLREANVTFKSLLDDVRHELAQQYLQQKDISLTEIAFLLGFSEQSAFSHAFRGWFGVSPRQWRSKNPL